MMEDVQPWTSEPAMPSLNDLLARVEFSPPGFTSWDAVAGWYNGLSSAAMKPTEAIGHLAQTLTRECTSEKDKVRVLYEWVRDNVRYIAVSIGIGGFKPHEAGQVLQNRYGDCKDMVTLLCALARAVDINMKQVLISTQPNGQVDTTLVSPYPFNHVIAYAPEIDDEGLWLDPTKKGAVFGTLPWYNRDTWALVVQDDHKGVFKRTPMSVADSNLTDTKWRMRLPLNGPVYVTGSSSIYGDPAAELREVLLSLETGEQRQWIEGYVSKQFPGAILDSCEMGGLTPQTNPLTIRYTFHGNMRLSDRDTIQALDMGSFMPFDLQDILRTRDRRYNVQFRYPFHRQLKISIQAAPSLEPACILTSDTLDTPFGTTGFRFQPHTHSWEWESGFSITSPVIHAGDYTAFQHFLDRSQAMLSQMLILKVKK